MSRIEFADGGLLAAVPGEAGRLESAAYQGTLPAPVAVDTGSQRRLREALADLGPLQPLPPPPRPTRAPSSDADVVSRLARPETGLPPNQSSALSPGDIVRALASVSTTEPGAPRASSQALSGDGARSEERPPRMIERALAAQTAAASAVPPVRLSPWPGLSLGLTLAVAAGYVLYRFLLTA